ncbi:MAG: dephospho-CoA kinase [Pseudorhodobacter sp.]|nr:dephospho-CoA kinase [Pseudorhodobacter sp.]
MTAFLLGLTGSIGMGKSTTAGFFVALGIPVWDADAAVHRLYAQGGAGAAAIAALCPSAVPDGAVDRAALADWIARDPATLAQIEAAIHPLVAADRTAYLAAAPGDLVVLDIPLLFETGADALMDATLLVTAPPALQRARVLARPGMTETRFRAILARQMPDAEKRARATHIIETLGIEAARRAVQALVTYIREGRHA